MSGLAANARSDASPPVPARDWLPTILFLSLLLPIEVRVELGDFTLYSYRLVLLSALPFAARRMLAQPIRFTSSDAAIAFASAWITVSVSQVSGFERGLVSGGVLSLDMLMAYFIGRIYIRSSLDLRRMLYSVAPVVVIVGVLIMLESVTHTYLVRRFFGAIFNNTPNEVLNRVYEIRLGLLRGLGPFQHPITGGILLGSLVPLYFFADLPRRQKMGLLAGMLGVFTVSSAALLSIGGGIFLVFYAQVQRALRLGWMPLLFILLVIIIILEVFTNTGAVNVLVNNLSLNPATGHFRRLIWDYGWADVGRHPWFGIGLSGNYYRPSWMVTNSVDNLWLILALRHGIPCLVGVVFCVVANIGRLAMFPAPVETGSVNGRNMKTGIVIALSVFVVLLFTVSPWTAELAWFIMLLGVAGGLADPRRVAMPVPAVVSSASPDRQSPAGSLAPQ